MGTKLALCHLRSVYACPHSLLLCVRQFLRSEFLRFGVFLLFLSMSFQKLRTDNRSSSDRTHFVSNIGQRMDEARVLHPSLCCVFTRNSLHCPRRKSEVMSEPYHLTWLLTSASLVYSRLPDCQHSSCLLPVTGPISVPT